MAPFTIMHYFSVIHAFTTTTTKNKKQKKMIVPFKRYWSFNSERHQKLLSLSPDSLSRVNKWQRCWILLLKRLLKDVPLEDNLNIFSSQVKLSLEFTNSLSQLTNNHTSASLLSVARTGLSFFFLFFSSRIVDATMIISLAHEQFFLFGDVQKAREKKKE